MKETRSQHAGVFSYKQLLISSEVRLPPFYYLSVIVV